MKPSTANRGVRATRDTAVTAADAGPITNGGVAPSAADGRIFTQGGIGISNLRSAAACHHGVNTAGLVTGAAADNSIISGEGVQVTAGDSSAVAGERICISGHETAGPGVCMYEAKGGFARRSQITHDLQPLGWCGGADANAVGQSLGMHHRPGIDPPHRITRGHSEGIVGGVGIHGPERESRGRQAQARLELLLLGGKPHTQEEIMSIKIGRIQGRYASKQDREYAAGGCHDLGLLPDGFRGETVLVDGKSHCVVIVGQRFGEFVGELPLV